MPFAAELSIWNSFFMCRCLRFTKLFFFLPLAPIKQFPNKLFIPRFFKLLPFRIKCQSFICELYFSLSSRFIVLMTRASFIKALHFFTNGILITTTKKKRKKSNAIFHFSPLSLVLNLKSVLARTASKHAILTSTMDEVLNFLSTLSYASIIRSLISSLLIEWNLKRNPYFNQSLHKHLILHREKHWNNNNRKQTLVSDRFSFISLEFLPRFCLLFFLSWYKLCSSVDKKSKRKTTLFEKFLHK